ncbi:MAG: hypothetical protein QOD41_2919 [Cryptosporangiaceae bacterium]|nr:hypothetical protein [Cryptosporangiaceae bacterium]
MERHRQALLPVFASRRVRVASVLVSAALVGFGVHVAGIGTASATDLPTPPPGPVHDRVVSQIPAKGTPNILDGKVLAIAQVGNTVIAGGDFTQTQSSDGATTYPTSEIVAFDATTGAVSTTFLPALAGGRVNALLPGPTPNTVYVGGSFSQAGGANIKGLTLLDVGTGARVASFAKAPMNGMVTSMKRVGDRLIVAGSFTSVQGAARGGLASVSATTGVLDDYVTSTVTEHHNYNGTGQEAAVGVDGIDVSPDGRWLVAIGNFKKVDGLVRDQAAVLDLSGTKAVVRADWRTRGFEAPCARNSFDSTVRGIAIAPDSKSFTIVSTGAGNTSLCDTAASFSFASTGDDVKPVWVDYTGGDSLYAVAVTAQATYVGGHQRYLNNPTKVDAAGSGALARPGLAAISTGTGMPLSWNPGRNPRGLGTFALYPSAAGLWVGSDTEWIGNYEYKRGRIAFFPLAGGTQAASETAQQLPGAIYLAAPTATTTTVPAGSLARRNFDGTSVGSLLPVASGMTWTSVRATAQIGGYLYYAKTDGLLYRRTFDGRTFGAEALVDPYNDPHWAGVPTGSGTTTFTGVRPGMYGSEMATLTSMWFSDGRIYYTLSGSSSVYSRAFNADSGAIHSTRVTVPLVSLPQLSGAFVAGGQFYFVNSATGTLNQVPWVNGAPSGATKIISGPANGSIDYRARAVFFGKAFTANTPPTPAVAANCSALDCTLGGSGSTDTDGSITSYAWTFGDGATATGTSAAHSYAAAGTYTVTLTVTDDQGGTGVLTKQLDVAAAPASPISFRAAATKTATFTNANITVPAQVRAGDGMALVVTTGSAVSVTTPPGWTPVTSVTATDVVTTVFQRVATASDAGSTVPVALGGTTKVTAQIVAYAGTHATSPVTAVTASSTTSATTRTAPAATVTAAGSWAVWYWAGKAATAFSWTGPAGGVSRLAADGTGTGTVSSLMADSGSSRPAGAVPPATATSSVATTRGTSVTLVFTPAS